MFVYFLQVTKMPRPPDGSFKYFTMVQEKPKLAFARAVARNVSRMMFATNLPFRWIDKSARPWPPADLPT